MSFLVKIWIIFGLLIEQDDGDADEDAIIKFSVKFSFAGSRFWRKREKRKRMNIFENKK
jgi:hypothetical protein